MNLKPKRRDCWMSKSWEQRRRLRVGEFEYLLDDDAWLYLDDIQNEVSFDFSQEDVAQHKCIEKEIGDYHYLLVILDYKNQRSVSETNEEKAAARMMLLNQRKQQIIKQHVDQLYEKALKSGSVTQ